MVLLLNTTGTIANIINQGTVDITGSIAITFVMIAIVIIAVGLMFRMPIEWIAIFMFPLLSIMVFMFANPFLQILFAVIIIFFAVLFIRNLFIE
jgi:hypothetical protein